MHDCCNSNDPSLGSSEEQAKRKLEAYRQTMKFFSPMFNDRDLYVDVSACGLPSTEDGDDNMGTRRLAIHPKAN